MNTTIHPGGPTTAQPSTTGARPMAADDAGGPAAGRAEANSMRTGDEVQLTESARAMGEAARRTDAPLDARRVDQIRQSIADGTYVIDPQRVADRLVAFERQLG